MARSETPTISSGLRSLAAFVVGCGLVGCGAAPVATTASPSPEAPVLSSGSTAMSSPVGVDVVTSSATGDALEDAEGVAREALERELAELELGTESGEFNVSAKVLKLNTTKTHDAAKASCTVSTTLHHRDRGLVAMLQGSAQAEDAPHAIARVERSAIEAAARGSLRGLPDALARID